MLLVKFLLQMNGLSRLCYLKYLGLIHCGIMEINRFKIGVEFFIEDSYLRVSFIDTFYHFLCNDLKV